MTYFCENLKWLKAWNWTQWKVSVLLTVEDSTIAVTAVLVLITVGKDRFIAILFIELSCFSHSLDAIYVLLLSWNALIISMSNIMARFITCNWLFPVLFMRFNVNFVSSMQTVTDLHSFQWILITLYKYPFRLYFVMFHKYFNFFSFVSGVFFNSNSISVAHQ